jgi:hypothetical protein
MPKGKRGSPIRRGALSLIAIIHLPAARRGRRRPCCGALSPIAFIHWPAARRDAAALADALAKNGSKNILNIFHFPLANFDPPGVIYLHRKKVGFCLGGSNPKNSEKALTSWTEWEYAHHDILKKVSL